MRKKVFLCLFIIIALIISFSAVLVLAEEIVTFKKVLRPIFYDAKQIASSPSLLLGQQKREPLTHTGEEWYADTRVIYHAAGGIDGVDLTNSREALINSMEAGGKVIEIDFLFTSDGHLVCAHEWADLYALEPITLKEIMSFDIYRKYTHMTAADLIAVMEEYSDLYIVIDTKETDSVSVIRELVRLSDGNSDVIDRFIIQLYAAGLKKECLEIYPFKTENFLFTAYTFGANHYEEIFELCFAEDVRVVTVRYDAWTQTVINMFRNNGIVLFAHTVNDAEIANDLISSGVQGVYTDFLLPEDIAG